MMSRGRFSLFGLSSGSSSTDKVSPPRRFSASQALEALRQQDPALFHHPNPEEKEAEEPQPKPKRFSSPANILPSKIEPLVPPTTTTTSAAAQRRRSSRKSVNGMIIEIDFEDESEIHMFEQCEDYVDNYQPDLKRTASNESLEELRTRLEALEHERDTKQLPEHDDYGWGVECMRKQLIEALECSSNSEKQNSSSSALKGIADFAIIGEDEEEEEEQEEEEQVSRLSHQARRSTVRSSVHGLVLEYDWSSGSESEAEDEPPNEEEES